MRLHHDISRYLFLSLFLVATVFACAWLINTMRASGTHLESSLQSTSTPSALTALLSTDVDSSMGDFVFLSGVNLESNPAQRVFIISGSQGNRAIVVSDQASYAHLESRMDITGQIRRLPSSGVMRKQWGLSQAQIRRFTREHFYIAANELKAPFTSE